MKTVLNFYAVIMLFLFQCSFAQGDGQTKSDVENDGYKGKVKLVERVLYKAKEKSGQVILGERTLTEMNESNYLYQYNEMGHIIEEVTYRASGVKRFDFKYKYDEKGNRIERLHYNSARGILFDRRTYEFDDKGNEIEQTVYGADGSLESKNTYKYDEKGNLLEDSHFNSTTLIGKRIHIRDEKGWEIEGHEYGANDKLESRFTFQNDEKGNLVETNEFNSEGNLISRSTHKFDDRGNEVEEVWYDARGRISWKADYQYDTIGNQIEIKRSLSTGVYTYRLEYDQRGNVIKQLQYRKGSLEAVMITRIEYYPENKLNNIDSYYHNGQTSDTVKSKSETNIFETTPEPKGGWTGSEFRKFFSSNFKYPKDARKQKIKVEGEVRLEFVVSSDGTIKSESVRVIKGVFESIDNEVKRVITLIPKWTPGTRNGQPIDMRIEYALNFQL